MSVSREQRFSKKNRCPICGGCDQDPRGEGRRCTGYLSSKGKHILCSREEHSGALYPNDAGLYVHRRGGECECGVTHADDPEIEAIYDYCDDAGTLLFQVIRKTGKRFLQRRPDGAGGWEWKTAGMRMVLYGLPELVAARQGDDPIIFVCEGEKDVEAARRIGLVATCNPRGAGKWRGVAESARTVLAGADVVVIQDNDAPGEQHARAVCDDLVEYAAHVRWLKPPVGKDLADWIAAGADAARILDACRSATSVIATREEMVALASVSANGEGIEEYASGPEWIEEEATDPPEMPHRLRVAIDADDPRPEIRISLEFHETVSETIAALAGMRVNGTAEPHGIGDPKMFQRSLELVSVARYVPPPGKEAFVTKGQPVIFPIGQPTLQTRLSQYARFFRRAKVTAKEKALIAHGVKPEESWDRCLAPPNVMQAVLAAKEWPGIRPLVGVTETPMLRPDGTLAVPRKDRAEYDWSTGYLLVPGLDVPAIPDEPTQSDAKKALRVLLEPFLDFPFAEESHRMVPIAAILTMLARAAIGGAVPGFVFDAATRGSGKTKQCDVVSLVALGRHAARATFPSNDDELEKMLSAYAIAGTPLILLDNVTRPFGGGPVDKVLTAEDCVDLRILGKSEIRTLVWRAVLLVSGNNIVLGEDTIRRVFVSRLESKLESPERRADFRHADLLGWVREHRTRLVAAALTILRAYCCIGRPTTDCELDMGFAAWNRLIPHAIRFAGGVDVMLARPRGEAAMTDEMGALGTFLRELPRLSDHPLTSRSIVDALWPAGGIDHDHGPDGWEDMRAAVEAIAPQRTAHVTQAQRAFSLGKHLRKYLARVIRGMRLREGWDTNGNRTWRVEKSE